MSRYSLIALCALSGACYAGAPNLSKTNGALVVDAGESVGDLSTKNGSIHIADNASVGDARTFNGRITLGTATTAESLLSVNGAIFIGADDHVAHAVETRNGRISVGRGAHVVGPVTTSNGAIVLESSVQISQAVKTRNGRVSIGSGAQVAGAVATRNGAIVLGPSADISGSATTINGSIYLDAAHVGMGIETMSGNIELGAHSRVEGGIWIRDSDIRTEQLCNNELLREMLNWLSGSCEPQLVVIGPDSVVQGALRFEHPVRLYVSTSAHIGPVQGAQAIAFTGQRPSI